MAATDTRVHVTTQRRHYTGKDGRERVYETHLLRRSYRDGGKVKNETVANLSRLPAATLDVVRRSLAGENLVPAGEAATVVRSVPHGDVALAWAQAKKLGLPGLLGPACRSRDLAMGLIISRAVHPASKLATISWWDDTTLGADLGIAGASTDEVYAAMDWLSGRQDSIENKLARKHLAGQDGPARMALFDLSSSWVEGRHCELAARGYSRDGKKGRAQIEYGLLTDPEGRPVAIRVFAGNTADPKAFTDAVTAVKDQFRLTDMVMVGDRGMITTARIDALRDETDLGWLTALRAPAIKKLAAAGGPLQPTLFDEQNLAEISSPDFPGERLVACRNPLLAAQRARKRDELLAATEHALAPIVESVTAGRLSGADNIGLRVGKTIGKYKMAKHIRLDITDHSLAFSRKQDQIAAEAALDGIYVIRTTVAADQLDAAAAVGAYKDLAHVERDFRHIKADDLAMRPIFHRLESRVRAHVLIVMLACYLTWHLRQALAPLTFTDQQPPERTDPVAPATRSRQAQQKASRQAGDAGVPVHSYQGLLAHLATLTRSQLQYGGPDGPNVPQLATPTETQRQAFDLIDAPIPTEIK